MEDNQIHFTEKMFKTEFRKIRKTYSSKKVEEDELIRGLTTAAEWGFPLTHFEIRCMVKRYLDINGVVEKRFKENFPGPDWILSFLDRHRGELSARLCENIKSSRAEVDEHVLRKYFQNLAVSELEFHHT